MTTILNTIASALRAILRGLAQDPYVGLCGPIPWPTKLDHDESMPGPR
jgi:hypothetical protein